VIALRGGIFFDELLERKVEFGIVVTPELESKITSVSTRETKRRGGITLFTTLVSRVNRSCPDLV